MEDWIKLISSVNRFAATELTIFDFDAWLKPFIDTENFKKQMISQAHCFRFTINGMVTKRYVTDPEFSKWRGRSGHDGACLEPFKFLKEAPTGFPVTVEPKNLGNCFLSIFLFYSDFCQVFEAKFLSILPEYAQQSIEKLKKKKINQYKHITVLHAAADVEGVYYFQLGHVISPLDTKLVEGDENNPKEKEFIVESIIKRKWARIGGEKVQQWLVKWERFSQLNLIPGSLKKVSLMKMETVMIYGILTRIYTAEV